MVLFHHPGIQFWMLNRVSWQKIIRTQQWTEEQFQATVKGAEVIVWCRGDLASHGNSFSFKHPEEHNSLCLCTISFSIDKEMNADVVCHSLKLCKQDPGQPLCHLYPPPKVSWFSTFLKATDCGRSFKLELDRLPVHVLCLGNKLQNFEHGHF